MDKLIDYICDEIDVLEKKAEAGKLSMSEIQYLDTLAHTKKNLLKSEEMMDDGYSSANDDYYAHTSYARGRGADAKRDSKGRYSSRAYRGDYSRDTRIMDDDRMMDRGW